MDLKNRNIKKLFNILGQILSLSSKFRPFTFITILIILAVIPISVLENLPNLSICNKVSGRFCYSVGITRGVSSILKGNFGLGLSYNPLSFLVLICMISILTNDLLKRRKGKIIYDK